MVWPLTALYCIRAWSALGTTVAAAAVDFWLEPIEAYPPSPFLFSHFPLEAREDPRQDQITQQMNQPLSCRRRCTEHAARRSAPPPLRQSCPRMRPRLLLPASALLRLPASASAGAEQIQPAAFCVNKGPGSGSTHSSQQQDLREPSCPSRVRYDS